MFAYVGCRTTRERNSRGDGINVYRVVPETGEFQHVQLLAGIVNPSFLALSRDQRTLYCVHGDGHEASAFRIAEDGTLKWLNAQDTQGRNPAHLAVDPDNRFLIVSNHYSGTVAVLPINDDGSLGALVERVEMVGEIGPHRIEQQIAKPHFNPFDPAGRHIVVPDKGLDRIFSFRLDGDSGRLLPAECPFVNTREGAGPRHIAFHPRLAMAYAVNELDSTVTSYRYDSASGRLEALQILSALPQTFVGNSRAAEIEVDAKGRFVYASNRGYDSIAVFEIDPKNGLLTLVEVEPSGGRTPRFFALSPDSKFLHVANEDSDTLVTFAVDQRTGRLTRQGEAVAVGSPTCIVFKTLHGSKDNAWPQ